MKAMAEIRSEAADIIQPGICLAGGILEERKSRRLRSRLT
jgi:hypothetical protein